jgi:hypothetical protein
MTTPTTQETITLGATAPVEVHEIDLRTVAPDLPQLSNLEWASAGVAAWHEFVAMGDDARASWEKIQRLRDPELVERLISLHKLAESATLAANMLGLALQHRLGERDEITQALKDTTR